jgi:hypothetical protein
MARPGRQPTVTHDSSRVPADREPADRAGPREVTPQQGHDQWIDACYAALTRSVTGNGSPRARNPSGLARPGGEVGMDSGQPGRQRVAAEVADEGDHSRRSPTRASYWRRPTTTTSSWQLRVLAATGARRGEVCGIQLSDVDRGARTLSIKRSIASAPHGPVRRSARFRAVSLGAESLLRRTDGRALVPSRESTVCCRSFRRPIR